jgi:hypothetical protein
MKVTGSLFACNPLRQRKEFSQICPHEIRVRVFRKMPRVVGENDAVHSSATRSYQDGSSFHAKPVPE